MSWEFRERKGILQSPAEPSVQLKGPLASIETLLRGGFKLCRSYKVCELLNEAKHRIQEGLNAS